MLLFSILIDTATSQNMVIVDIAYDFKRFKKRVYDLIGMEEGQDSGPYIEVLWDIYDGTDNFTFDFEELRLTKDLLLGAILLAKWKGKHVVFCSPTSYYAWQAIPLVKKINCTENGGFVSVGVPGQFDETTLKTADVFLHHGRDFRNKFPEYVRDKRHVIQIFPGEDTPCDTRSLRSLVTAGMYRDD